MTKINNHSPINNRLLNTHKINTEKEVKKAYQQAKTRLTTWQNKSIKKRLSYLTKIRKVISQNLDEFVETIVTDTGKVEVEALMTDILASLDLIKYYEKHGAKVLKTEQRKTPFFLFRNKSYVSYEPFGVVAIIAPWNFPLQLALVPAISAITAGNTVLLKPSEVTPEVGELLRTIFKEAGLPKNVIQILQGGAKVGQALIQEQPDKIFFTGSVATGKKIMQQAAQNLIPVELELGGKDPMIVLEDANFDRAVEAAVYGAFSNSGQLCVSVERLYVAEKIYQKFVEAVVTRTKELRVGEGKDADLGAITYPEQIKTIKQQLEDAQNKGAQLRTEFKENDYYLTPTIVTGVNHDMKLMTEETFGPVLAIMPFSQKKEAIELANDSKYGLNSSVWSQDISKARTIAEQLEVGNCYINDVVKNIGNPYLPFGGVKNSGIGRYHGPEGLYTFSQQKSIMINKQQGSEFNWFPFSKQLYYAIKALIKVSYTPQNIVDKGKDLIKIYREFKTND